MSTATSTTPPVRQSLHLLRLQPRADDAGCYTLALNDILAKAVEAAAAGATELHMVGGLHPDLPFDFYLEMLAALRPLARSCISRPSPPSRSTISPTQRAAG